MFKAMISGKSAARRDFEAIDDDVDMLVAVGEALYGASWQPAFARLVGISTSHLYGIVERTLTFTPAMRERIAGVIQDSRTDVADDMIHQLTGLTWAALKFRGLVGPAK